MRISESKEYKYVFAHRYEEAAWLIRHWSFKKARRTCGCEMFVYNSPTFIDKDDIEV
jgi:hypothetical protein